MPTSVKEIPLDCKGVHESCLRSWHLLEKTRDYLRRGVPSEVVLELLWEIDERGGDAL